MDIDALKQKLKEIKTKGRNEIKRNGFKSKSTIREEKRINTRIKNLSKQTIDVANKNKLKVPKIVKNIKNLVPGKKTIYGGAALGILNAMDNFARQTIKGNYDISNPYMDAFNLNKSTKKKENKPVNKKEKKTVDKKETKVNGLAPPKVSNTITIKKGDTLSEIAKKTPGVTLGAIKKANPNIKDLNKISIGQKINMPGEEDLSPDRKSVYEDIDISKITMKKQAGGPLRPIPAGNKGLPNLPTPVRNKMGFKKRGGRVVKRAVGGGVALRGLGAVRRV
jgi:LysM repeat protein